MTHDMTLPTEEEARQQVAQTHPECLAHLVVRTKPVYQPGAWFQAIPGATGTFLECESAGISIRIQPHTN